MNLQQRIDLLVRLGEYISANDPAWQQVKEKAGYENGWFIPAFVEAAVNNISCRFLQRDQLENWLSAYPGIGSGLPKKVGIVMAGNIPLVGFHDWLSVFISGHQAIIKPSSKDQVLIKHLAGIMNEWITEHSPENTSNPPLTVFAEMLKGCDAYIATGSNNSSRYFEYYFGKYPHIIRKNKTSVAVLTGDEKPGELELLADDVYLYFGSGCRNVTKVFVPEGYDFVPLLEAFKKYNHLAEHHKYKNNYDYNLALHILNKKFYMTNGSVLLVEEEPVFSPISQLNYAYYSDRNELEAQLKNNHDLQCITGSGHISFGLAQCPGLSDYADGIDTLAFLSNL